MKNIDFFNNIINKDNNYECFTKCCKKVKTAYYEPGKFILKEGELATCFYIILNGSVEILKKNQQKKLEQITVLETGQTFGKKSLTKRYNNSNSIRTIQETILVILSNFDYQKILMNIQSKKLDDGLSFLSGVKLFTNYSREEIEKIYPLFQNKKYKKGETIFKYNDESNYV